jgi:Flp pilus assembly protein TadD
MVDAENYYRTALSIDPNFPSPIYNLAVLTRDRGDNLQAADLFRRYVALVPDDALGHYNLGLVLLNLGQTDEAMRELAEAQRLQPDLPMPSFAPSASPGPSASAAPPTRTPVTTP